MTLDDHLLRDEQILASVKAVSGGFLYATNQRVIIYKSGLFGEKVDSLSYSHIVSASYEKKSYLWAVVLGFVIIIIGAWSNSLTFLGDLRGTLSSVVILGGIFLILLGLLYKEQFYQIKAVGLSETERQSWRTAKADTGAKTFARFIQDQIVRREIQTPQSSTMPQPLIPPPSLAKEVITKERRLRSLEGFKKKISSNWKFVTIAVIVLVPIMLVVYFAVPLLMPKAVFEIQSNESWTTREGGIFGLFTHPVIWVKVTVKNSGNAAGSCVVLAEIVQSGSHQTQTQSIHLEAGQGNTLEFKFDSVSEGDYTWTVRASP